MKETPSVTGQWVQQWLTATLMGSNPDTGNSLFFTRIIYNFINGRAEIKNVYG